MTEPKAPQARSYRTRLKAERSDRLYLEVLQHLLTGHRYRDPHYTATRLAADLQTNTRYISAAVANSTGDNFNALVNSLRVRDACRMLSQARFDRYTVEEVGLMAGFSSRQAFYLAFSRRYQVTPLAYRRQAHAVQAAKTEPKPSGTSSRKAAPKAEQS